MDVDSVRSGHSQKSDRSRRSQLSAYNRPRIVGQNASTYASFVLPERTIHSGITAIASNPLKSQPLIASSGVSSTFYHPGSRLSTPQHSDCLTNASDITYLPQTPGLFSHRNAMSSSLLAPQTPGYNALVPHGIQQHLVAMDGEQIEVQILPTDGPLAADGGHDQAQLQDWGDNTTAINSDTGVVYESEINADPNFGKNSDANFDCASSMGSALAICLGLIAFLSPIAMVVLPKMTIVEWKTSNTCTSPCFGQMIGLSFKLLILLIGTWALFFRGSNASMPRVYFFRAMVLFLIFIVTFTYWLFYGVRILENRKEEYHSIVLFVVSFVDTLLFINYLAIVLLELRHLEPRYSVHVVRSPDGESHTYRLGEISVQRAAVIILQNYMTDFQVYNPYLEAAIYRRSRVQQLRGGGKSSQTASTVTTTVTGGIPVEGPQYKFYDVDTGATTTASVAQANSAQDSSCGGRGRGGGPTERFYDELDYDKRLRKRRVRFIAAVEEAFAHIRRVNFERTNGKLLDPHEAAQAVFPTILKPLQKYLRITRQQPRYTMEMVIQHLATSISHDLGPHAFIGKYLIQGPIIEDAKGYRKRHMWTLISSSLLSRGLIDGCVFQLRQGEVSLLCNVRRLPFFSIAEEILDPKRYKYVLQMNSETSV